MTQAVCLHGSWLSCYFMLLLVLEDQMSREIVTWEVSMATGQRRPPRRTWHLSWVCLWELAEGSECPPVGKRQRSWHILGTPKVGLCAFHYCGCVNNYPETEWCRTTIYLFTDSAGQAFGQGMVGVCPALWYLGLSCGAPRLERNQLRSGSFSCLAIDAGVTRGPQFLPHEPLPVGPTRELAWASSHDDGVQGQVSLEGEPEDRGLF